MASAGPPPPLDPECAAALAALPPRDPWSTAGELIAMLRNTQSFDATDDDLSLGGVYTTKELTVAAFRGGEDLPLLLCRPRGAARPPAIFYVHGGGMCSGNRRTGLLQQVQLARLAKAAVISVEYRLAPEHRDPVPLEDCYSAFLDVFRRAGELGIDDHRVVVMGSSAGGGLAAGVCLLARDRDGPRAAGQLLMNPMLDDRGLTYSGFQMAGIDVWDKAINDVSWEALLGERRGGPDVSQYSAPARATDLSGLPPTYLDVGTAETFRDEVVDYAARIWRSGGVAELHVWPGGFHGYDFAAWYSRLAQETWEARLRWLRRTLGD